jgi:hypothetical protein
MSERRKIAARPYRPAARHPWEDAAVEALDEELGHLDPRSRAADGKRVRAKEQGGTHDLLGIRLADAAGVAAQEPDLQLVSQLRRDRFRDELSEAGVDTVGPGRIGRSPLDDLARRAHPLLRRFR